MLVVDVEANAACGGGWPAPTPMASTPDSKWPSSDTIDQRTV